MLQFAEWPGKETGLEGSWHWDPPTEREGWERRAEVQAESQGGFHGGSKMKWELIVQSMGVGVPS